MIHTFKKIDEIFKDCHDTIAAKARKSEVELVGIAFELFRSRKGASHSAPIGKRTNFARPQIYDVFEGRIWIRMSNDRYDGLLSNLFDGTYYHIGTGGGGCYNSPWHKVVDIYYYRFQSRAFHKLNCGDFIGKPCVYSWAFNFWMDDFPEFKKLEDQKDLLETIAGKTKVRTAQRYEWTDHKTAYLDDQFRYEDLSKAADRSILTRSELAGKKW